MLNGWTEGSITTAILDFGLPRERSVEGFWILDRFLMQKVEKAVIVVE
ncbi:hypothetical protein [Cylindrospermum sp. FACHB-282]|nr:hypothetical protein [Cylindrospermum sp. FACHB-282]MBD2388282.1 hypothetical protein [Cylindrospermum sp. FACHB-282]